MWKFSSFVLTHVMYNLTRTVCEYVYVYVGVLHCNALHPILKICICLVYSISIISLGQILKQTLLCIRRSQLNFKLLHKQHVSCSLYSHSHRSRCAMKSNRAPVPQTGKYCLFWIFRISHFDIVLLLLFCHLKLYCLFVCLLHASIRSFNLLMSIRQILVNDVCI